MTNRSTRSKLATLIGIGAISVAAGTAVAGNCNWMKGKGEINYKSSADYHHAAYYGTGGYESYGAFMKAAHHGGGASMDIVETAVSAGSFNTLVAALKAAALVETLEGEGPFTVFAPTDEAFAKIPQADLDALLKDKEGLTKVLTYHVVPGKVMAADVAKLKTADTVEGQSITIDTSSGVKVNDAKVVKADIKTSNGVIHVIDTVLMPKL